MDRPLRGRWLEHDATFRSQRVEPNRLSVHGFELKRSYPRQSAPIVPALILATVRHLVRSDQCPLKTIDLFGPSAVEVFGPTLSRAS